MQVAEQSQRNSSIRIPHRLFRRPLRGAINGLGYGALGGLLALATVPLPVAALIIIDGRQDTAAALLSLLLVAAVGVLFAGFFGAMVGASAGFFLGLLRVERFAPFMAAVLAGLLPLGYGLALVTDGDIFGADNVAAPTRTLVAAGLAIGLVIAGFAWSGYFVGTKFALAAERSNGNLGDPGKGEDAWLPVVQPGEQQDGPPAGWAGLQQTGQPG